MRGKPVLHIARADETTAAQVAKVAAANADAPRWPSSAWKALGAGEDGHRLFCAYGEDGSLWGWIGGTCRLQTAEIETVFVVPARRRGGVAAQLLLHWLDWVRGQGAVECLLEVRASNAAALELYRRAGFQVEGRRPGYYATPEGDAILLRRSEMSS